MSVTKIDQANLGFVILAFCIAHVVPLDLLLFSYAILGPAHYLTEISWLHGETSWGAIWRQRENDSTASSQSPKA